MGTEPLNVRGLAGPLVVTHNFLTGRLTMTVGGRPAERIGRTRRYALPAAGGGTVEGEVRGGFFDPYPSVYVGGVAHRTGPLVPVALRVLALLPVLLLLGGLLGGLVAALGVAVNQVVVRLSQPNMLKAVMMLGVAVGCYIVWYILAAALISATR
jgi:hypothetical protein